MHMTAIENALTAFKNNQIGFDVLLRAIKGLSQSDNAAVLTFLEAESRAGHITQAVYTALLNELSDQTRIAQPQTEDSTVAISPSADRDAATVIANRSASASEATIVANQSPHPIEATVIANPAPEVNSAATQISPATLQTQSGTSLNTDALLKGLDASQPYQELAVGDTIKNRFVLQELIGKGGMGMVFKAMDLRKVEAADKDPYVALKVLSQDFKANPMALIALQRETKRAQTLSHPHIINVYDFDRDGQHVFMTMEYLEGTPLSHFIKQHPDGLPFKKAWPIIHAVADALRYAHQKNIVHSDFKPGNVFIDQTGDIRVLDFGIACAISHNDKEHPDATIFDARALGAATPAYASLEQLRNSPPDPRDDIYALACVSYELLTGKHPFGRLSAEKARELNLQPKAITQLARRRWKGLQKALAIEQAQRTASIDEFLDTLGPRSALYYGLWTSGLVMTGIVAANIYFGLYPPVNVVEAPKIEAKLTQAQQQQINDLLELASIHADVGYLTAPTGSNALWAYREVLKIDPYNQAATKGIFNIGDELEQQAWETYENGDRAGALKKVQEGLDAVPSHEGLQKLKDKLTSTN